MPRVRPLTENARKDKAFREQLMGEMKANRMTYDRVAEILCISVNTLYRRRDEPETLTLREKRILEDTFPGIVIQ